MGLAKELVASIDSWATRAGRGLFPKQSGDQ